MEWLRSRSPWDLGSPPPEWGPDELYLETGLHTNACGDFLIAARKAFENIRGFENRLPGPVVAL